MHQRDDTQMSIEHTFRNNKIFASPYPTYENSNLPTIHNGFLSPIPTWEQCREYDRQDGPSWGIGRSIRQPLLAVSFAVCAIQDHDGPFRSRDDNGNGGWSSDVWGDVHWYSVDASFCQPEEEPEERMCLCYGM